MRREQIERTTSRSGFTLVEVLLVIAILGILAGTLAVSIGGKGDQARIKSTRVSIKALATAVQTFDLDLARYPTSIDELITNTGESNWQGPYMLGSKADMNDAWGSPITITTSGGKFQISSAGKDKQMGTGDDLTFF